MTKTFANLNSGTDRQILLRSFESLIRARFQCQIRDISVSLVGSAANNNQCCPRDIDILIIKCLEDRAIHSSELKLFVESLRIGLPFKGAFESKIKYVEPLIREIVATLQQQHKALNLEASFVFGPAIKELDLGANDVHFHIAGPLTAGDLHIMREVLPFHAESFRKESRLIIGKRLDLK